MIWPKIKKKIVDFVIEESGKTSKGSVIKLGIISTIGALSFAGNVKDVSGADCRCYMGDWGGSDAGLYGEAGHLSAPGRHGSAFAWGDVFRKPVNNCWDRIKTAYDLEAAGWEPIGGPTELDRNKNIYIKARLCGGTSKPKIFARIPVYDPTGEWTDWSPAACATADLFRANFGSDLVPLDKHLGNPTDPYQGCKMNEVGSDEENEAHWWSAIRTYNDKWLHKNSITASLDDTNSLVAKHAHALMNPTQCEYRYSVVAIGHGCLGAGNTHDTCTEGGNNGCIEFRLQRSGMGEDLAITRMTVN
ncbi:MAG: hypothetical protein ABIA62_05980 [Candidatus Woesearchaeota archaeon]